MTTENFYLTAPEPPAPPSDIIALANLKGWTVDDIYTELGMAASLSVAECRG